MKKLVSIFLFLFLFSFTLYSKEISERKGMKVLKQIRKEIKMEEKRKEKEIKKVEKVKKSEEEKGKKIIEGIRRDMNESLEEKVFRSKNTPEARIAAAEATFEIGKERMAFLKMEEEEIMKLEEVLGMEINENRVFLSQKFDEVYDKFKTNNNEIEFLLFENKKLNEYLRRLEQIEKKIN